MKYAIIIAGFLFVSGLSLISCATAPERPAGVVYKPTSFRKISGNFIGRLQQYNHQHGQYASSTGEARFGDIGLLATDWDRKPYEGIVYDPKGDQLELRPAKDFTFFVNEPNGNTRILSHDLKWSLIFNLRDNIWYFYEISPQDVIDIKTLRVKKDTPYNPAEYRK